MAATTDIRFKRMQREYQTLHDTQDETLDKMDSFEEALTGLNEAVTANHDLIMANHKTSQRQFAELNRKLDAIIEDQNVPYKPMGFMKED